VLTAGQGVVSEKIDGGSLGGGMRGGYIVCSSEARDRVCCRRCRRFRGDGLRGRSWSIARRRSVPCQPDFRADIGRSMYLRAARLGTPFALTTRMAPVPRLSRPAFAS